MLALFEGYVANMVAQLTTALLAGGNVAPHRSMPTQDSVLPAASVTYMGDQARSDGDARTGIPAIGQLPQAGLAGGHDGDLGHRKHAVGDKQSEDDRQLEGDCTHALSLAVSRG